jgi:hypothetical protein
MFGNANRAYLAPGDSSARPTIHPGHARLQLHFTAPLVAANYSTVHSITES